MIVTCHDPDKQITLCFNDRTREWLCYTTENRQEGIPQAVMAFVVRIFLKYGQWICAAVGNDAQPDIFQCENGNNVDKVFAAASR